MRIGIREIFAGSAALAVVFVGARAVAAGFSPIASSSEELGAVIGITYSTIPLIYRGIDVGLGKIGWIGTDYGGRSPFSTIFLTSSALTLCQQIFGAVIGLIFGFVKGYEAAKSGVALNITIDDYRSLFFSAAKFGYIFIFVASIFCGIWINIRHEKSFIINAISSALFSIVSLSIVMLSLFSGLNDALLKFILGDYGVERWVGTANFYGFVAGGLIAPFIVSFSGMSLGGFLSATVRRFRKK